MTSKQLLLIALACSLACAQAPTGSIAGTVVDESGALLPASTIRVTHKETGLARTTISAIDGTYLFAALQPGDYELRAEAKGFRSLLRDASVETGSTTTADLRMQLGATTEVITVQGAAAQISYDSHKIDGVVTRQQIDSLPLNGRSFLQLASLEPGVTVATATLAQYNAQFSVSILGGDNTRAAITADGGNIRDRTTGNTSQNYSQEVVQEFQISSVSFDLSTPITSVGAINIVTRSGGNDFHGAGYFYFRDHNMSAYPALRRDARNPDPFFARRQPGFSMGGPILKGRLFFFFNIEHNNQDSVFTVQPNAPSVAGLAQIAPSNYTTKQISARFDYRISSKHAAFLRYSHDGNRGFGPNGAPTPPSNWLVNSNWSDQSIVGVTSTLSGTSVNDFRTSFSYWKNRNLFPSDSDCPGCLGQGFPQVTISGTNVIVGHTQNATQGRDYRTMDLTDNFTMQRGAHRLRFGGEWERDFTAGFWGFCDPACVTVYSPEIVRARTPGITVPSVIRTAADLQQLPVAAMTVGYGDPRSPAPYQRDKSIVNHRLRAFWQDTWRLHPHFTLNYGVAWEAETTLANHDLDKPAYLAPILGGGDALKPTRRDWNNFSPALGIAWQPTHDSRTVIRAGGGLYFDTQLLWERLNERQVLGPRGNGRFNIAGGFIGNTIAGISGVPVGTPLDFATLPTEFRLGHFMQMIPQLDALLGPQFSPNFSDLSIRGLNIFKSASGFATVIPHTYPTSYSMHLNAGVQRELRHDLALSVDFVSRQFRHTEFPGAIGVDLNHFNRAASLGGPVIPVCTIAQTKDPLAQCSTGVIDVRINGNRDNYRALLAKLEKRFANRYQFTVSYTMQDRQSVVTIANKDQWFQSFGPLGPRHLLGISGMVELPWRFQVSWISGFASRTPVMPIITSIDLDGDGSAFEPLPGARYNGFNRGLGKDDLTRLVADFNQKYAGARTPRNQTVPTLRLPDKYQFNDLFSSQDIRVTRIIAFRERFRISLYGEAFNLFNVANLSGYSYDLANPAGFGQPTLRANQIFGSGGPRAFQLGVRASF